MPARGEDRLDLSAPSEEPVTLRWLTAAGVAQSSSLPSVKDVIACLLSFSIMLVASYQCLGLISAPAVRYSSHSTIFWNLLHKSVCSAHHCSAQYRSRSLWGGTCNICITALVAAPLQPSSLDPESYLTL